MIILFDLDGTLIDSTEAILESFGVAYEKHGRQAPDNELIKAEIGHPLDQPLVATVEVRPADSALTPRQIKGVRRVMAETLQLSGSQDQQTGSIPAML